MNIIRFAFWMSLASFAFVTGCSRSQPDSAQLDQLVRRTSALEQQVRDLEASNAKLQEQVRTLQQREQFPVPGAPPFTPPRQGVPFPGQPQIPGTTPSTPPQNPRVLPPTQPPSNDQPHLTPLDSK